jgi:6-phosphogluconolactonase
MGRAVKALALSLAIALGLSACSNDYTLAYLYMATSNAFPHGLINAYQVDYQSGVLNVMPDSPIDAGGRNTVAIVAAPNNLFLYTVNNFDSSVVEYAIGTDGKLYPQHTYNVTGSFPTAAAIDAQGKFLYVAFTYQNTPSGQPLFTPANPGPGGVTVYPINSDNSLGTPTTVNVGRNPVAIATSRTGNFVYVIDQDSAIQANLLGFTQNSSNGGLTPMPGVTISAANLPSAGFSSGPSPAGILGDSSGTHLYVTDKVLNQVGVYTVAANGVPTLASTIATDATPMGMSFDLNGKYLYVAANTANVLNIFNVSSSGQLTHLSSGGTVQVGDGPTCVSVAGSPSNANPRHAVYLYTSNRLSNNVSGEQLNEQDGTLVQMINSPFGGSSLPACLVAVPSLPIRN